ncbi:heme lyase CcmF/NrfE family subunit [Salisaeta longa]|uniref:heme lyase CcmF/NrfE family subunit n=1 Tax=Salisaeta longa TaxID=503170 RepID=UPI0003B7A5F4|nr:cytochrome c biogenesis protein CcsA [Salisaeta longa]
MLGTLGEVLILVAFVACGASALLFFWGAQYNDPRWTRLGRWSWAGMSAAVVAASGLLWYFFFSHAYQYAYVYQHSSNDLPLHYLFSTFWAGQEGSFLLWILMMCGVGGLLIAYVQREYASHVLAVVALCQAFLLSMVVGLQIGPIEIGASPFLTLAEKFKDAPIFQQNPGFVPADGKGLNELLQNPWMTIHPPMLFAGFSSMVVPFAFAIAALWRRTYTEWVRPALPWTLFGVTVLGVGIAMGGYWAYVTLSFGGYWAWDPVENSSLVPWLVGVSAFHTMLVQKKSSVSQKSSLFFCILAYLLVIYSTFLTRSGILGDVSVHSFVSLGLYNQLLLWIAALGGLGFGLLAYRWRQLPRPDREPTMLSREFMIFSGAALLAVTALVIILGTSAPILGQIFRDNASTVPIEFYNKWTLPLAIGFVFLAGLGQLFWWNKMRVDALNRILLKPIAFAVVCTIAVLILTPFAQHVAAPPAAAPAGPTQAGLGAALEQFWASYGQAVQLLLLIFAGFFALFGNGMVLWRVGKGNPRMAGGALAHVGFAVLILGVVASSGFSEALPRVGDTVRPGGDQPRENFVLAKGDTRTVGGYQVTYQGTEPAPRGRTRYILDVRDPMGRTYTMKPVAYESDDGQWFLHPDVKSFVEKDLFAAVTPRAATGVDKEKKGPGGELQLAQGDSTIIGDRQFALAFERFEILKAPRGLPMQEGNAPAALKEKVPANAQMAVGARVHVTNLKTGVRRTLMPIYVIMQDRSQRYIENRVADWNFRIAFTQMNVNDGKAQFAIKGVDVMPEDWVVVQAYTKPAISLVWVGIIVLTIGFIIAMIRRVQDLRVFERQRINRTS